MFLTKSTNSSSVPYSTGFIAKQINSTRWILLLISNHNLP